MIHSAVCTIGATPVEIGIDTNTIDLKMYIEFNSLMPLFDFTLMDRTVDEVTVALLGTEYRNHIYIEASTEVMEDKGDHTSQQLWVDIPCLEFLKDESNAPFVMEDIVSFIKQNETELRQELVSTITI